MLSHNELFFPSPNLFNDPFDSNFPFHYDEFTREEFIKYWTDRFKSENTQISDSKAAKRALDLYGECRTPEGIKKIIKWQEDILQELRGNKIGIFSMSGNCSSILSWAHYSQSHEGFCIGFDKEKLTHFVNSDYSLDLGEVEYKEDYPIINVYKTDEHEKITMLFWRKSIEWKYENEHRIIWYDGANKTLLIDSGIISVVILGCRIKQENKDRIISVIKSRPVAIPIFQAKIKKNSFCLEFEEIVG